MYEWFISRRYLRAKHRQGFISLISLISVIGITVGVINPIQGVLTSAPWWLVTASVVAIALLVSGPGPAIAAK